MQTPSETITMVTMDSERRLQKKKMKKMKEIKKSFFLSKHHQTAFYWLII